MKITFRLDAHPGIGMGHLSRCGTLAAVLMARGCQVLFVLRRPAMETVGQIRQTGAELAELPPWENAPHVEDVPHAAWRGGSQEEDAGQTARAITEWTGGTGCDWIVVDHYGLDHTWERSMRPFTRKILVLDDLADRPHDCECLLDVNAYLAPGHRYASLVPANCRLLLGPRFALLRNEFQNESVDPAGGHQEGPPVINLSFGGADAPDLTGRALSAIAPLGCRVDAVLGPMNPHIPLLKEQWGGIQNVRLHQDPRDLAALFRRADLSVGAAGGTTWERMRMGLPTLLYSLAGNQTRIAGDCALRGACLYMGEAGEFCPLRLSAALQELLHDPARRLLMSDIGKRLVPPGGADRVANVIMDPAWRVESEKETGETAPENRIPPIPAEERIRVRPVGPQDEERLYFWANDPSARNMSFNPAPISFESHQDWFGRKLADPSCRMFIAEISGSPAGLIRYDFTEDKASIGIYVTPSKRGRRLGSKLLAATEPLVLQVRNPCLLEALCFQDNLASIQLFESSGFVRASESHDRNGRRCLSFHRRIAAGADQRS